MSNKSCLKLLCFFIPAGLWAAPSIASRGIFNAASYSVAGTLNSGIAQGSVFVIFGTGLGPDALVQIKDFPLAADLAGVTVRVTSSGNTSDAYPLYVSAGQVGAVLPSSTPLGPATVAVTYRGETSAPEPITVVRRNIGVFAANQAGSGPAIVQNFNSATDQPLNTLLRPAVPGQTVTLWATGLGPVTANEIASPAVGDLSVPLSVYVGGVLARVRYAGRSGCCAGIDQIVFDVPNSVQGCYVPVQISGSGLLSTVENRTIPNEHTVSNSVTITVAPDRSACTDPSGFSAAQLAALQSGGTVRIGAFTVARRPQAVQEATVDTASGSFSAYDLTAMLRSRGIFGLPAIGSCVQYATPRGNGLTDPVRGAPLDGGSSLTLSGPSGDRQLTRSADGVYTTASSAPFLTADGYSLSGPGGKDVGPFRAAFIVPSAPVWTNQNSPDFEHSFSPSLTFSGVDQADYVVAGALGANDLATFYTVCTANPADQSVSFPKYVYAGPVMHTTSAPNVIWLAAGKVARFDAPGLDLGFITALVGTAPVLIP